jgi:hypothetical protein
MQVSFSSPNTVDVVVHDPQQDEFVLIIVHSGEWDGSGDEENALLQKPNDYLHFILEGDLSKRYPEATGKRVRLQIDSASLPPENISELISDAGRQLVTPGSRLIFF